MSVIVGKEKGGPNASGRVMAVRRQSLANRVRKGYPIERLASDRAVALIGIGDARQLGWLRPF